MPKVPGDEMWLKAMELGVLHRKSMTSQMDMSLCLHLPSGTIMHWLYSRAGVGRAAVPHQAC